MKIQPKHIRHARRAFTLIELLLVLVILAVLAGVAVPIYTNQAAKAKISSTKASISNLETALQAFEVEVGRFPTTEEGLEALLHPPAPATNGFIKSVPNDGFGNAFVYRYPGTNDQTSYDLNSYGPDGTEGTEDDITKDTK